MKLLKKTKGKFIVGLFCTFLLLGGTLAATHADYIPARADTLPSTRAETPLSAFKFTQLGSGYSVAALVKTLTYMEIPPTYKEMPVVEIANNGFASCTNLETIIVPPSVKKIGSGAFTNCKNLKNTNMPGLETIGQNAFVMCQSLKTLVLPVSVNSVGANILMRAGTQTVYSRPSQLIADTWTGWDNGYSGEIIYGDELNCELMPDGSGYYVAGYQEITNATLHLLIDTHKNLPIVKIDSYAFAWCTLHTVSVGMLSNHSITVYDSVFYQSNVPNIEFSNNVTFDVSAVSLFYDSKLRQVSLPDTLTSILPSMFQDCKELESINFTSNPTEINILPSHITAVYERAFSGCSLPYIYISDSVEISGAALFDEWSANTQKIDICLTKADIELLSALWESTERKQGWDPDWNSGCDPEVIHYTVFDVFYQANGGSGSMSKQRFKVGEKQNLYANAFIRPNRDFVGWSKLDNAGYIDYFDFAKVQDIAKPGETLTLYSIWSTVGLSYTLLTDETYRVSIGTATTASYILIPTYHNGIEVSEIAANGFSNQANIFGVTLPRKIKIIANNAFSGCTGLTTFEIPSGVIVLGQGMLNGCVNLKSIIFPGNGTTPGDVTFKKMFSNSVPPALKTVTISGGSLISAQSFSYCSHIETVIISSTVKTIEYGAFSNCINLKNVVFSEGLEYIGNGAFVNCSSLTNISLPESLTGMHDEVFWGCTNLTTVILKRPSSLGITDIGWSSFGTGTAGCPNLSVIAVADSASVTAYKDSCSNKGWPYLLSYIKYVPELL